MLAEKENSTKTRVLGSPNRFLYVQQIQPQYGLVPVCSLCEDKEFTSAVSNVDSQKVVYVLPLWNISNLRYAKRKMEMYSRNMHLLLLEVDQVNKDNV